MTITRDTVEDAFSYEEQRELIDELLKQVKTTGMIQTEKLVEYKKLNRQRMNRIEKTT